MEIFSVTQILKTYHATGDKRNGFVKDHLHRIGSLLEVFRPPGSDLKSESEGPKFGAFHVERGPEVNE